LVNPEIIEKWSGTEAIMSSDVGFEFKLWDSSIWGKNIKVTPEKLLKQEWYGGKWKKPSIVTFELTSEGAILKAYRSDASSFAQAESLVKDVLTDFGTVDILVNNAGITRDTLILRMSEAQWDEVIQINLKSVFNLTKHAIRPMLKNRAGSIINMSSVIGVFGNAGQANYAASKAGIIGFSKSIAKELGSRNIRCYFQLCCAKPTALRSACPSMTPIPT